MRARWWIGVVTVAALTAAPLAAVAQTPPAPPTVAPGVTRLSGPERAATAAAIATAVYADGAATVYVATGADFPDALTGTVAAARDGAPLLLVGADEVPASTAAALTALAPDRIVVLGGTAAVGAPVEEQLSADGAAVERLSGDDRFATAAAVSRATFPEATAGTVYVATGAAFPDALAGGPAAATAPGPVLLVTADDVPEATRDELARLAPERVVVLGGTDPVSDDVTGELGAEVSRVSGADRFRTALAVSAAAFPDGADAVVVATGAAFPDALAGGAVAGAVPGPVLLVDGGPSLGAELAAEVRRLAPSSAVVVGGAASIPASVEAELAALLDPSGDPPDPTPDPEPTSSPAPGPSPSPDPSPSPAPTTPPDDDPSFRGTLTYREGDFTQPLGVVTMELPSGRPLTRLGGLLGDRNGPGETAMTQACNPDGEGTELVLVDPGGAVSPPIVTCVWDGSSVAVDDELLWPRISEDGSRIAVTVAPGFYTPEAGGEPSTAFTTVVLDREGTVLGAFEDLFTPAFTPDNRLVMGGGDGSEATASGLYLTDADYTGVVRVDGGAINAPAFAPDVSPDGGTVVFAYNNQIWQIGLDGNRFEPLVQAEQRFFAPTWSPDGEAIALGVNDGGDVENGVLLFDLTSGAVRFVELAVDNVFVDPQPPFSWNP